MSIFASRFRRILACLGGLIIIFPLLGQPAPKAALTHDSYDRWHALRGECLSDDGRWLSYERAPQRGDGWLYLRDLATGRLDSVARGQDAQFLAGGSHLVFRIVAPYDSVRAAKRAGKKGDTLPPDTLGLWTCATGSLQRLPDLRSFALAPKGGHWVAYQYRLTPVRDSSDSGDSTRVDSSSDSERKAFPLGLLNPRDSLRLDLTKVTHYAWADSGQALLALRATGDSIDSVQVVRFAAPVARTEILWAGRGAGLHPTLDAPGRQAAFLLTPDTTPVKYYALYYQSAEELIVIDSSTRRLPGGWTISPHQAPQFSPTGQRLFFGTAPAPPPPPKDSLLDEEKVRLDLWHWQDARLQSQQLKELKQDAERHFLAVWDVAQGEMSQLGTETVHAVSLLNQGEAAWALGTDSHRYDRRMSWESPAYRDLYLIDVQSGEATLALEAQQYPSRVSPDGEFIAWYNPETQAWHSYITATGTSVPLTLGLPVAFYDEDHDTPAEPSPYGLAGWTPAARRVILYDRYDLWACDPSGQAPPQNLTRGQGRRTRTRLRYLNLDREAPWLPPQLLLHGQEEESRAEAFWQVPADGQRKPRLLLRSAHHYARCQKARHGDRLLWTREDVATFPDLWTSDTLFALPMQQTLANPQQQAYRWATVEPVRWTAFDGTPLEGLLYKPDDFDPSRSYPMLVYFYERKADTRHTYYAPLPSRSIIYPSYYCSNDYLVFIPDVRYQTGQPGEDAYTCIVSGTEHLIRSRPYIDSTRLGLQGQSWGGYQVAYLITRTGTRFAAAMAGAPVSNMTSAYGGIRWGSGLSRMFQYEETQSRLGATLWDDPERYLRNSPLFQAPAVATPLLMMHNDADGAVPWYQGIEFFTALRRLDKPAWLLVYNDEAHNLTRWPNRVDLSIRMQQFFDHYLKEAPAPPWLRDGIPAQHKGRTLGYE